MRNGSPNFLSLSSILLFFPFLSSNSFLSPANSQTYSFPVRLSFDPLLSFSPIVSRIQTSTHPTPHPLVLIHSRRVYFGRVYFWMWRSIVDVRIVDVPLSDPRLLLAQTPRMPESWGKRGTRARFARVGNEFQRHVARGERGKNYVILLCKTSFFFIKVNQEKESLMLQFIS